MTTAREMCAIRDAAGLLSDAINRAGSPTTMVELDKDTLLFVAYRLAPERLEHIRDEVLAQGVTVSLNVVPGSGITISLRGSRPRGVSHEAKTTTPAAARAEQRLRVAGRVLPRAVRDRQVGEWIDHVEAEREAGGDAALALRSILLRSVIPIAISSRARSLGRALARPR